MRRLLRQSSLWISSICIRGQRKRKGREPQISVDDVELSRTRARGARVRGYALSALDCITFPPPNILVDIASL